MSQDILAPLTFRNGVVAKNRVWLAPMTNQQSHADGSLSDDELAWLAARAKGGFGVIETCAAHVALDGQGWTGELGIFDDRLLPGLTRVATTMRAEGALSLVQIFHGGVRAPSKLTGQRPWSASELPADPGGESPRAATEGDIENVIEAFKAAAVRAHRAGFDGVELHGAHGYLLSQFLSATMNLRDDAWGGPIGGEKSGRARLVREVTRAVRSAVPDTFLVGVRLSPEDFGQAKGLDLDETIQVARLLCDDGVDFLHLSLWDVSRPTAKRPTERPVPLFRDACPSTVRIVVAGKIWTRDEANALLAEGADAVALGRSAITNPDWPSRIVDPSWEPRRPPISRSELLARAVSPTFAQYMTHWRGFVSDS